MKSEFWGSWGRFFGIDGILVDFGRLNGFSS